MVIDFFERNRRAAAAVGDAAWGLWTIIIWTIGIVFVLSLAYLIGSGVV